MNLPENELNYLRQVLGVEAIFSSPREKGGASLKDVHYRMAFVSHSSLSDAALALVEKMAGAIGCADYFVPEQGLNADLVAKHGVGFVIAFGDGDAVDSLKQIENVKVINFPPAEKFLDESNPSELKKLKKTAWDQLKVLKTEIESWSRP